MKIIRRTNICEKDFLDDDEDDDELMVDVVIGKLFGTI